MHFSGARLTGVLRNAMLRLLLDLLRLPGDALVGVAGALQGLGLGLVGGVAVDAIFHKLVDGRPVGVGGAEGHPCLAAGLLLLLGKCLVGGVSVAANDLEKPGKARARPCLQRRSGRRRRSLNGGQTRP